MRLLGGIVRRRLESPAWIALRELPSAGRALTGLQAAFALLFGALPIALILATGALVSDVTAARESAAWRSFALIAVLTFLSQVLVPIRSATSTVLGSRFDRLMRDRLLRATLGPAGIAHLETPEFADLVERAQRGTGFALIETWPADVGNLVATRIRGVASAAILATFRWWAPLVLLPGWLITRAWLRRLILALLASIQGGSTAMRRSRYLGSLGMAAPAAKEMRVFGLTDWVARRFRSESLDAMREIWRRRSEGVGRFLIGVGALVAGHTFIAVVIANAALSREIGAGEVAVYIGAMLATSGLGFASDDEYRASMAVEKIPAIIEAERRALAPSIDTGGTRAATGLPREEIRFEGVRFRYAGRDRDVFEQLDLTIPAGHSLSIVGDNGAGKTTLLKLLTRLYDPQAGRILVDGVDVRDLDVASWRSRIGIIFQDFVRYPFPASDNVGFGCIERLADTGALVRAAERAGALPAIEAVGWDAPLSRQFAGGSDLSGGEWQRIGLARALFAIEGGAQVLVLDEPTASLDVRSEAELFDRFLDLTRGLTTILISHRFSTVRRADRICVLREGRLVETGSHDELMSLGGHYARMFTLQASRFDDDPTGAEVVDA